MFSRSRLAERAVLGDTEPHDARVRQPRKCALPDKALKAIIRFPLTRARPLQQLEFESETVMLVSHHEVKAMESKESNRSPSLAGLPAIWTPVWFRPAD